MDTYYKKFLRSGLDLSAVGFLCREDGDPYFCTPKGAKIIGWAGVDGIHFCFVRGFGDMVFAVSPANSAPDYVHPLAKSFADFLRLLLACGDTAAPEQAWMWNEEQFTDFLRENTPNAQQQTVLSELSVKMGLTPTEEPYACIRAVQEAFDYGKLKFGREYQEVVPQLEAVRPEILQALQAENGNGTVIIGGSDGPTMVFGTAPEEEWNDA